MPGMQRKSMCRFRYRILLTSLLGGLAVAAVLSALGGGSVIWVATVCAALFGSLACLRVLAAIMLEFREERMLMVASLQLTEDAAHIKAEKDDLRAIGLFDELIVTTVHSRRQERQILLDQIVACESELKLTIDGLVKGDDHEVARVGDAVAAMESMKAVFSAIISEIDELSGRSEERAAISAQIGATTDGIAENIGHYSTAVIETAASIEHMAEATRETADNINGLSASTEQTVSAITQISASQANVNDNAERGAEASGNVRKKANQGLSSMAETMRAMEEIARSSEESVASINRLSSHLARVGEFLNVIQDVVDQTNLLSLNASIIAAQAGERGKAFAVVAAEVRSLAQRTSASTKEIEELVRNIHKETAAVQNSIALGKDKVREGVKISALANEALATIDKSAEEASLMVADIATETAEQASGLQSIAEEAEKNLERVRQITLATEQQKAGTSLIVRNLEHMRELAHRVNSSAQEQAKGNRLYLKSVMEDNERTQALKEEAQQRIEVVGRAVEAVLKVEQLINSSAANSRKIQDGVRQLAQLVDNYRSGKAMVPGNEQTELP